MQLRNVGKAFGKSSSNKQQVIRYAINNSLIVRYVKTAVLAMIPYQKSKKEMTRRV